MARNRILISIVILLMTLSQWSMAQTYGNEWIDSNQRYFKFKIGETGIYRISRTDLLSGGFPVGSVDPRRIQLFHLGQEVAIQLTGQSDGAFDATDFIEFYGQKNDGETDTELYIEPAAQPHTLYNIFSDSSAYFLTYRLDLQNGLRMETFFENNVNGVPAESSYTEEQTIINTTRYYEGKSHNPSNQVLLGDYDYGEGWTGEFATRGQSLDFTFNELTNQQQGATVPQLELLLAGGNNNQHNVSIFVGTSTSSLRLLTTAEFNADDTYFVSEDLEWSDLSSAGELVVRATINGVDGQADRAAASYLTVSYTRNFDFSGLNQRTIELFTNPGNESFLSIQNPPSDVILYDITSPKTPITIGYNTPGSNLTAMIDNTLDRRTLYLQSSTNSIGNISETTFSNINPTAYNLLVISHPKLRENTSTGQTDQVQAYKTYRESTAGGGHSVLISNVDDIFNQFNYGNPSPIAIRRFCQYMYDNGSPEFLFIIGKASNVQANYYRQDPEISSVRHFVPTWGYPGADVPFSSGFDGGIGYETVATGRINADSPDDVKAYLDKIIEEEGTPVDNLRRKNLVHLSGGNSENELTLFRNYIDGFADIASQKMLGGESAQISKNNNSAVELINISDEINAGTMMVTFFGHSSGSVTDIEIGLVSDPSFGYANKGKYPVFMVNGCLAGDFFSETESFGVDWILTPNLGATAFMAHSHVAFSGNLRRYTDQFYELAFGDPDYIVKTIGEIKMETSKQYLADFGSTSKSNLAQVQLVNLQGDPASFVFGAQKPDFSLDENLVKFIAFDDSPITTRSDSFYIEMNIKNFGIATDSTMNIEVVRTLANGSTISYGPLVFEPTLREETIQFVINNDVANSAGTNIFRINIDPFNSIDEINKNNNSVELPLFLSDGSTINLLPTAYSNVNSTNTSFFFQASNILTNKRNYDFQLDTIKSFNSPYLINQTNNTDVVSKIDIDLASRGSIVDGQVFYWRSRFTDPLPNESSEWVTSSFTLDRSMSEGWTQQSYDQLSELTIEGMTVNTTNGLWEFVTSSLNLEVNNFGSNHPSFNFSDTEVKLDGQNYFVTNSAARYSECRDNTINFMAFKRQSNFPFKPFTFSTPDDLNPLVCGRLPSNIMNYASDNLEGGSNPNEYIDLLASGDKVVIFSLGTVDYSTWTDEFKTNLESLGINRSLLDDLNDDEPIILLGAKDAPNNSAIVVRASSAPANTVALSLEEGLIGNFDSGNITTTNIGPANQWQEVSVNISPSPNPDDDQRSFRITGIDISGNETNVFQSDTETSVDLGPTGLNLDADIYPYIRLDLALEDNIQFTPEQLNGWEVSYETVGELVLVKRDRSDLVDINERQEGDMIDTQLTLWNISQKDFSDSIKVNFDLFSSSSNLNYKDSVNSVSLAGGDSTHITLSLNTRNKTGDHDLSVTANKLQQKEIFFLNNEAKLTDFLRVIPDEVNPILEVSFDGLLIMDGDIVAPSPAIQISMKDENEFILKEDTLGVNFYIRKPCENCDFERVAFNNPTVTWTPATEESAFQVNYQPEPLEDGIYGLRVQAVDGSGNESGIEPFEVSFEVINQSTITNFYPYPNPFSSSTRFVFTLTGSEIPEDIKIQIMTVSGRIVKEIFMNELGPINIGNNKTEYAWDGRDNFGDQLANGVYLYRVMIKNPGENFEHRNTSGDRGFKNGFGKLYLLR